MTDPKVLALAAHFQIPAAEADERITLVSHHDTMYEVDSEPGEYLVLNDSEADTMCDAALEDYIDECILPECPAAIAPYFDRDSWKRDALLSDGRGHTLSSYDGAEEYADVDGVTYYIYRTN